MPDKQTSWWKRPVSGALIAASVFLAFSQAPAAAQERADSPRWFTTWSASPGFGEPADQQPGGPIADDTVRIVLQSSLGGDEARIRLSNLFGDRPLVIRRATIALSTNGSKINAGSLAEVAFNGDPSITIQPGGSAISDPIDFDVPARKDLSVSLYVPREIGAATSHQLGVQTSYVAAGDQAGAANLTGSVATTTSRYFLTAVDVKAKKGRGTIVTFGDSITDGFMITLDSDLRWPDQLARRLLRAGLDYGVANQGISGNGHVVETQPAFGQNASARFDRDVLSHPNVTHMIVLLGINDIGQPGTANVPLVTANKIIDGLAQLIARAKAHGVKVYGATLTPFEGTSIPGYFTPEGEVKRQKVNDWIRNGGAFDAVIDFDKALADPKNPTRILPAYDYGDGLHPNDAGFTAMAAAIDLGLFR